MNDYSVFFAEVIQTHAEIEQCFAGLAPEGMLEHLMVRFSPHISIIEPITGKCLGVAALSEQFKLMGGQRPGLKITVSELKGVVSYARGAVVTYREQQIGDNGHSADRRSTVVFEKQANGTLLWRHLHETFCKYD